MNLRSERNKNAYKQINQQIAVFEAKLQNKESTKTKQMLQSVDPSFFDDLHIQNADVILEKKIDNKKEEVIIKKKNKKINIKKLLLLTFLFIALGIVVVMLYLEGKR